MPSMTRLFTFVVVVALACAARSEEPSIVVAAEDDWAPYSSMKADQSGPEGFSPDLVTAAFRLKGVSVKFVTVPFARCLQMVKTGRAVACFNTAITDGNRDEFYWHKTPIFEDATVIFALVGYPGSGLTARDLEGESVGVTTGYTYPAPFALNRKIKKVEANADDLLLKMLVAGRVKFILMSAMSGLLRINQSPDLAGRIKQVGLIGEDGFWLNFSKAHPDGKRMADIFESGLQELKASGAYAKMQADLRRRVEVLR